MALGHFATLGALSRVPLSALMVPLRALLRFEGSFKGSLEGLYGTQGCTSRHCGFSSQLDLGVQGLGFRGLGLGV